jgi:hypothetical protein
MPGSFSGFGIRFLYPENWSISEQTEGSAEAAAGVSLETPEGAFLMVHRYPGITNPQQVIDRAVAAMREEYDPLELEEYGALASDPAAAGLENPMLEAGVDLSFYVLDLLITARMLAIVDAGDVVLVQMQAESRDFDRLEAVFAAVLKTLRDSLAGD